MCVNALHPNASRRARFAFYAHASAMCVQMYKNDARGHARTTFAYFEYRQFTLAAACV